MRATLYDDGIKRINAKIEIPMAFNDLGDYILCAIASEQISEDQVQTLNKRQLLRVAKDEIYAHGVEYPRAKANEVSDVTNVIIRNYVKRMFPELE
jgi:hypothetical protein